MPGGVVDFTFSNRALSTSMAATVQSASVDLRLNAPAECSVTFAPGTAEAGQDLGTMFGQFPLGTEMTVAMGMDETTRIFSGQVAALEPNLGPSSRTLGLTGYDCLFKLKFGTKARTFENCSDSQIAQQVIEGAGLAAEVDGTQAVYPYVLQKNVSDYSFLMARAARLNFEVFATDRTIHFRRSQAGRQSVLDLEYAATMSEFTARMRAVQQGSTVRRTGWNPKTKQTIGASVSSGPPSDRMGGRQTGYGASSGFGGSATAAADASIIDTASAEEVAQGAYGRNLDTFLEGSAECPGNPRIRPGINVGLSNIGGPFDGLYYVTAARHSYDVDGGYVTRFELRRTGI